VRERAGHDFIIIYRLSMLDLVNGGSTLAEVTELARRLKRRGDHHQHRYRLARSAHSDHRHAGAARRSAGSPAS
jgi:2,4-dienoyl-CoA reductase-like NADH-dependent reductase (Old Yellow Enzyme family)